MTTGREYEGMLAETVRITGDGGDEIGAYMARPLGSGPYPAVIVLHHMPGWDDATKEITRRIQASRRPDPADGRELIELCYASDDFAEGIKSFLAKRPPKWTGQ